jgi:hypothetical protein
MEYELNNKKFKTKKEITDFYKSILYKTKLNTTLKNSDLDFVLALLEHHPEKDVKKGEGIEYIRIEKDINPISNTESKYPHFHIYRKDNSNIDFSFHQCIRDIDGKKDKSLQDFKKVMRFEVSSQTMNFKKNAFKTKTYIKCPILNINCSVNTSHVDHEPPFSFDKVLYDFMKQEDISYKVLSFEEVNGIYSILKDRKIAKKWKKFHEENAKLRITHQAGNMSQKRDKKYIFQ